MPVIDGGGMAEIAHQLGFMAHYLDAVNATDNAAAHAHVSPLAVSLAIRECGSEPIMQLVCRDRNRLALEADIMGAALHGIENLCCLTGDDVTAGDEPEARRVFDLDSVAADRARPWHGDRPLPERPRDRAGAGAVHRSGRESGRAAVRVSRPAGCEEGAGRRPLPAAAAVLRARAARGVHGSRRRGGLAERVAIIPSVIIVRGAGALRYIDEHVPGIAVPAATIERAAAADDQLQECEDIAFELARHAMSLPGVAGIHFISFRRDAGIARLCERLGIPTREERESVGDRPFVPA